MVKKISELPKEGFLRLEQVLALYPVGRTTWLNGCNDGIFPAPFKLSPRVTAWRAADIKALIQKVEATQGGSNDAD